MLVALAAILLIFNVITDGRFFRPVNMVTLVVQAIPVAILATGMVLVIVSRNIDLSVGSLVGFIAMTYALLMTDWLPNVLGIGADVPFRWLIAWRSASGSARSSARSRDSSSRTSACRPSWSPWAACCRSGAPSGTSPTAPP
jgi:ABC-type xylose transport system permease subunit